MHAHKGKIFSYYTGVGRISLPIYLIHVPVISVIRIVLLKIGITNIVLHIVAGIAAVFVNLL